MHHKHIIVEICWKSVKTAKLLLDIDNNCGRKLERENPSRSEHIKRKQG